MARPFDLGDTLDYLVLGTMRSPGKVKLSGHDRNLDWDIKAAKGQTGASSTLNAQPLGEFEAEFELADDGADPAGPTDFDAWEDFQRLCESTVNGPTPVALPIYHPDLARNRYTEVVLRGMGGMVHDGRGGATVKVKFGEHRPPKAKPPKGAQPKPGAPGAAPGSAQKPDPSTEGRRQLDALPADARKP
jgi:hypothetical protein